MSGRGDSFTDKVMEEVRSTFALAFKQVGHKKADLDLSTPMTHYSMGFPCATVDFPIPTSLPDIHDPLASLHVAGKVRKPELLSDMVCTQARVETSWAPVVVEQPVIPKIGVPWHRVTFDNVRKPAIKRIVITPIAKGPVRLVAPKGIFTRIRSMNPEPVTLRQRKYPMQIMGVFTKPAPPHLYGMPILKYSVPLHRFSYSMKERFRKALAEKADTRPGNIQLTVVYDRMIMNMFSSFSQDSRGNMVCYPKPELVGRSRLKLSDSDATNIRNAPVYLVYGVRLDNQEAVRALVPVSEGSET